MTRRKHGNYHAVYKGIKFMSLKELAQYKCLELLEIAGQIKGLKTQPKFPIKINGKKVCTYIADFCYFDVRGGPLIVEDVKGRKKNDKPYITPMGSLKIKLFKACYPEHDFRLVY